MRAASTVLWQPPYLGSFTKELTPGQWRDIRGFLKGMRRFLYKSLIFLDWSLTWGKGNSLRMITERVKSLVGWPFSESKSTAVDFIFGSRCFQTWRLNPYMHWHKQGIFFPFKTCFSKSGWAGEPRGERAGEDAGRPSGEQEPDHMWWLLD